MLQRLPWRRLLHYLYGSLSLQPLQSQSFTRLWYAYSIFGSQGGIVIGRVCWFVGLLVTLGWLWDRKKHKSDFMKFGKDVRHPRQMSLLTFVRSGSNFTAKLPLWKSAGCSLRYLHQIRQSDRSIFGMNYATFDKKLRWRPSRPLRALF